MTLLTTFPALPMYVFAVVALFAKTSATSIFQVISRLRAGTFLLPEDARMVRTQVSAREADIVARFGNVWRNDTENLPLFFVIGLSYVLLGGSAATAQIWFGLYVALRYAHTVIYLLGLQPWRAIAYLSSLAVCWVIAFKALMLL